MTRTGSAPNSPLEILLVNQYFPPDESATALVFSEIADALRDAGHSMTVLCGRPSYGSKVRLPWRPLRVEVAHGVVLERIGSSGFHRRSGWGRAINYFTYLVLATLRGVFRKRPDVVIAGTDPPLAILAGLAAKKGRPLVYSVQDLHPDAAIAGEMIRAGTFSRAWDRLHTWAAARSDRVVCIGYAMAERLAAKGIERETIAVVPHGAPEVDIHADDSEVARLRASTPFLAVHAGNIGASVPWETLAKASSLLRPEVDILFVGDGVYANQVIEQGVRVVPFLPRESLGSVMAAGDVQLVGIRAGSGGNVAPSKFFTALSYGRPVLAVVPVESDVARLVREWECGEVADPDDPDEVAEKLIQLQSDRARLKRMEQQARAAATEMSRSKALRKFVRIVEESAR